jgi:Secretion system C-terminal sorting domain
MKKMYLGAALITLASLSSWAQPVATSANVTDFTGEFYFAEATNFDPGPAGANQTWDFSNLQLTLGGVDTPQVVSETPFASQFPTANNCYKFSGLFPPDRYYYQNVTAGKYEILGLAITATTGDNYTPNPRTFATFPYSYGTVYNDTYRSTTDPVETSVVATYDAYGTIILPIGTYTNVIRQKVVKDGTVTNYNWFNVQPFYPILQTVLEQNSLGILKNTSVLANEHFASGEAFTVFPNPTQGRIAVLPAAENNCYAVDIELFDYLGQVVIVRKEYLLDENGIELDLAFLQSGMYLLRTTNRDTNASNVRKIVKK